MATKITEMQKPTKVYGRRPFGVGILVAGYDVRNILISSSKFLTSLEYLR